MAIRLKDLKKNSNTNQERPSKKEKMLRPWESFDASETRIRTVSANKAVEKAQERLQEKIQEKLRAKVKEEEEEGSEENFDQPSLAQDPDFLALKNTLGPILAKNKMSPQSIQDRIQGRLQENFQESFPNHLPGTPGNLEEKLALNGPLLDQGNLNSNSNLDEDDLKKKASMLPILYVDPLKNGPI